MRWRALVAASAFREVGGGGHFIALHRTRLPATLAVPRDSLSSRPPLSALQSLTTSQKRKVEALIALTGSLDNDSAKRLLIDYGWDVETAADAYMESVGFATPTAAAPAKGG